MSFPLSHPVEIFTFYDKTFQFLDYYSPLNGAPYHALQVSANRERNTFVQLTHTYTYKQEHWTDIDGVREKESFSMPIKGRQPTI